MIVLSAPVLLTWLLLLSQLPFLKSISPLSRNWIRAEKMKKNKKRKSLKIKAFLTRRLRSGLKEKAREIPATSVQIPFTAFRTRRI